jgi:hypothetical protein
MARFFTPSKRQETKWAKWVASRPPIVRAIGERFDPWTLYLMKSTGQRVTLASIFEDGTVSVDVSAEFNLTLFESNVFGISPDDLEPCEIPSADELTGAVLTSTQVDDNIDALRCLIRPDLFMMSDDGKATRKS